MTRYSKVWRATAVLGVLALAGSGSAPAQSASRYLKVDLRPQETAKWCWAASAEMALNLLGTDVAQCTQANDRFNRSDCPCGQCGSGALANPPCVSGGWPEFGRYGFAFRQTSVAALAWPTLRTEIDAGRPVAFSWAWKKGGGHMMVAAGYLEMPPFGTPYVLVYDPWPPCTGDVKLISYAAYRNGTGYSHWHDFYGIERKPPVYEAKPLAPGGKPSMPFELNTNRPGGDFRSFDLDEARPELCREACLQDPRCRAFTYVKPGVQGRLARCWLKDSRTRAEPAPCCISGERP